MSTPADAYDNEPILAIDRLDCYRVAVEFCTFAATIRPASRDLREQLERASASIVLNLAEGVGRYSRADQSHFFVIARGSAFECAAVLDVLHARGALSTQTHRSSRATVVRIVQMLSRLSGRTSGSAARRA